MGASDRLGRTLRENQLLLPLIAVGAAAALAGAALLLDRTGAPSAWNVSTANMRLFLATVAAATITTTAVVFWIRGMVLTLASTTLSPRVLRWYLEDAFEVRTIAFLVGAFTYVSVALLAMPSADDATAPMATSVLAVLLSIGEMFVIIISITNSVQRTEITTVLSGVARRTIEQIRAERPATAPAHDEPPAAPADAHRVLAARSGWVRHIDVDALLRRLPAPSTVWLRVCPGAFVIENDLIAVLTGEPTGDDGSRADEVRDAVVLAESRAYAADVTFGVRTLVDIALGGLSQGTIDSTSAYEAIKYLGTVVRELLLRSAPPRTIRNGQGVTVVRMQETPAAEYVHLAFAQFRQDRGTDTAVAVELLGTLGMLVRHATHAGRQDNVAAVREEARQLLLSTQQGDLLPGDRERILAEARRQGFDVPERAVAA